MRSVHGAGFLYELGSELHLTPDIIIASSGNAGNAAYFVADQYEFLRRAWLEFLSKPAFISFTRPWRMMDIDWLIDTVFKRDLPLNTAALLASPTQLFIPITDARSGEVRYARPFEADPFEILRAAKAIPILFRKKVPLFSRTYLDGELGPTLEDHVAKARAEGATRIVIVDDSNSRTPLGTLAMKLYAVFSPKEVREALLRDLSSNSTCIISHDVSIICVKPNHLPVGLTTRNHRNLLEGFSQGRREALALASELRRLFDVAS